VGAASGGNPEQKEELAHQALASAEKKNPRSKIQDFPKKYRTTARKRRNDNGCEMGGLLQVMFHCFLSLILLPESCSVIFVQDMVSADDARSVIKLIGPYALFPGNKHL
jgi:hypothetical protein